MAPLKAFQCSVLGHCRIGARRTSLRNDPFASNVATLARLSNASDPSDKASRSERRPRQVTAQSNRSIHSFVIRLLKIALQCELWQLYRYAFIGHMAILIYLPARAIVFSKDGAIAILHSANGSSHLHIVPDRVSLSVQLGASDKRAKQAEVSGRQFNAKL